MHNQIILLQEEVTRLRRELYAAKSEKHISLASLILPEGGLFNEAEHIFVGPPRPTHLDAPPAQGEPKKPRVRSPESGGRKPLPADLPRERVVHDLVDDVKVCPNDGATLVLLGEEVTETLEFVPASLKVIEHVTRKYGCPECESHVARAEKPAAVMPGAQCGPGLIAHILVCKFMLALPFYRQEDEFAQMGIELSRTSMARWAIGTHAFLVPLLTLLKDFILKQDVVHADETTVQVLKEKGRAAQAKSYMWTLCTAENEIPAVWYEYHETRSQDAAAKLLEGYAGLLHVDGYAGYNAVCKSAEVTRVGCWAHARRKFDVAKKDGAAAGHTLSGEFLDRIQKLFLVERDWTKLEPTERQAEREKISRPIVDGIKALLEANIGSVTPKSKLGMAMNYLQGEWESLVVFLSDGRAAVSNNRMENFIRPFTVGRKNWLFSDTVAGAHASAGLYSLMMTAKANGLEVRPYLISLLTELPTVLASEPGADLSPYLPWNYKASLKPTT